MDDGVSRAGNGNPPAHRGGGSRCRWANIWRCASPIREHGYYTTRDPLGARGDFITAPEISQMFGELIGLWMAAVWKQMGAPENIRIIELGPGRGTMMNDALRAAQVMPAFRDAVVLHLVEISPALEAQQERTLEPLATPMFWHPALDDVPQAPPSSSPTNSSTRCRSIRR